MSCSHLISNQKAIGIHVGGPHVQGQKLLFDLYCCVYSEKFEKIGWFRVFQITFVVHWKRF